MTRKDVRDNETVAHLFTFIAKDAYSLLKTLAFPEKFISAPCTTPKELLLNQVKYASFE